MHDMEALAHQVEDEPKLTDGQQTQYLLSTKRIVVHFSTMIKMSTVRMDLNDGCDHMRTPHLRQV